MEIANKPEFRLTLADAAEIVYGVEDLGPYVCYCHTCEELYGREDMTEDVEPHGEITLLCPKGHYEVS